jgi:hypothetical protein
MKNNYIGNKYKGNNKKIRRENNKIDGGGTTT